MSALLLCLGHFPSGHPVVPAPRSDRRNGQVVSEGSLDGEAWRTFTVADGSSGNYLARVALNQRGRLRLRVIFRDGAEAVQTITVR